MPHTFRILPGPSLWPLLGQLTQLVHAELTASPHKAWGSQKIALLPIKEKSGRASCSVGLGAGLMKSGHKVRSLPEVERLARSAPGLVFDPLCDGMVCPDSYIIPSLTLHYSQWSSGGTTANCWCWWH